VVGTDVPPTTGLEARSAGPGRAAAVAAVAAATAALGAWAMDWSVLKTAAVQIAVSPGPLALALAAYLLAFCLRAAAWQQVLPRAVGFGRRLQALLAMLAVNHALPGPVGELTRARLVADDRPGGLGFRAALASVAAARVVDVASIAVLAMGAAALAGEAPGWLRAAAPAAAALPVAAWALARRRGAGLAPGAAARAGAFGLASWFLECGIVSVVAAAAGLRLSVPAAVLATCGAVLAQVAAVLPGGVGTYEAGMSSVLVALGVPPGDALAVATATHAVKFVFAFALGGPALLRLRAAAPRPTAAAPA